MSNEPSGGLPSLRTTLLFILLPLVFGIGISLIIPRPIVGMIYLNDAIYSYTAREMIEQIRYAKETAEVQAVVLVLDSPGGTVTDTEAVYLELAELRQTKPVITMVQGLAASGAYYLASGTNDILGSPSSQIGNVGVIATLPPSPGVLEDVITTGPYKMFGSPRDTFLREMEMIKEGFYQAVLLGRGDRLNIGPEVLLRGQIWSGSEALRLGLIDDIASTTEAIQWAADKAGIRNYEITDLRQLSGLPELLYLPFFLETPEGMLTPYPKKSGIFLLFIPSGEGRLP